MKDFNLSRFLRDNPLTKASAKKGNINEAFEGFGGVKGIGAVGDGVLRQPKDFNFDPTDTADYDEQSQPNKWIADIDRMQPSYGDWKASWEHPGLIVWSHADIPDAVVVATPGWDGKGTPVEFQSGAGSTQMLKVLDQDIFPTFKAYLSAVKPYLDMVLDANLNSPGGTMQDAGFQGAQTEGYMGTQYDSSEDMAVDMVKTGVREALPNENDFNNTVNKMRKKSNSIGNRPSRIEGLVNQRELAKFAEAVMAIAQDLDNEGFDAMDIKIFLKDKLDDMIIM